MVFHIVEFLMGPAEILTQGMVGFILGLGMNALHSLKDARERVLVGGQANLTDNQLLHIGIMGCGEAVVHQDSTGQAVSVQVTYFRGAHLVEGQSWTGRRVANGVLLHGLPTLTHPSATVHYSLGA